MSNDLSVFKKMSCRITVTLKGDSSESVFMLFAVNPIDVVPEVKGKFILDIPQDAKIECTNETLSPVGMDLSALCKILEPGMLSVVFRARHDINAFIRRIEIRQLNIHLHDRYWNGFLMAFRYAIIHLFKYDTPQQNEVLHDPINNTEWLVNEYEAIRDAAEEGTYSSNRIA